MTRSSPQLVALMCTVAIPWTAARAYPRIDFEPDSGKFAEATEEYREIWRTEGGRISAALEQATGLHLEAGPISAIVFGGVSSSGYPQYPMYMRADLAFDTKRATLVHELAHRLISGLVPRNLEDHPVIFLFVYDVWVKLWGQEFADEQVAVESERRGRYDYESAWRDALALGAEGRAKRWSEFLAARQH